MSKREEQRKRWEEVQKKAFLHWVNSYLIKLGSDPLEDLITGFSDGVTLIQFLETLTGEKVTQKYSQKPRLKVHCITNCYIALKHLENLGVSGLTIAAENLVDYDHDDPRNILGFCWQLLRKFPPNISVGGEENANNPLEERLLGWCRDTLVGYKDIEVEDFKSFEDGKVLLALLEQYDKNLVSYGDMDKSDAVENCRLALQIAEDEASIPQLLDPEELASGKASDKNLVLYLTLLYNAFGEKIGSVTDASLLERIEELEGLIEELSVQKEELEEQSLVLTEEHTELSTNIEVLSAEKSELEKTSERAREDWLKERAALLARIAELEEQIGALESSTGDSVEKLQALADKIAGERDELKQAKEQLQEEIEELGEEFSHLTKKFSKAAKAKAELEEEVEQAQRENSSQLTALKKNLRAHFEDMAVWKIFLDQGIQYRGEFIREEKNEEISGLEYNEKLQNIADTIQAEDDELKKMETSANADEAEAEPVPEAEPEPTKSKKKSDKPKSSRRRKDKKKRSKA
eukprot:TRINITY_DN2670_c0_g1_i1.p1 TRINITY_DN2670_c0_g1~~TRINITY_DN2670_c0_g1_i1.p1  ORF type:complete len:520 (-),score=202.17 TRINITY_DN2670_c0_g1_i1:59-1618(-)